jgi:hypothetical protein
VQILAIAQLEGVEAAALHEEEEVARDVPDRQAISMIIALTLRLPASLMPWSRSLSPLL